MHPSFLRLLECARAATKGEPNPVRSSSDLWKSLGETAQRIGNWKRRGVSEAGAIAAEAKYGCSPSFILRGEGAAFPALQAAAAPHLNEGEAPGEPLSGLNFTDSRLAVTNSKRLPVVAWSRLGVVLLYGVKEADVQGHLDAADASKNGSVWAVSEVDYPRFGVKRGRKLLFVPVASHAECTEGECYLFKTQKGSLFLAEFRALANSEFEAIPDSGPSFDSARHEISVIAALRQIAW